ncbi:uncharacterized protein LOC125209948 [Salvia hispanica]|uniref:uncharacterized protein LOC125194839 n=1 Tax=Salvia hispanica TaxID=49212 RepID=UPI002009B4BE|nr:uncharacterized protein LOC125194839 [Salvia hispanica]XP_047965480.1 uncharacterized protein LOC125209948 [Salvia hispanica]
MKGTVIAGEETETLFCMPASKGDLAYDIMTVYNKLVAARNKDGVSPLHILANKPSAFESGSKIRGIDKLIYHCIFVDKVPHSMMPNQAAADLQYKEDANYPENYHTCLVTFNQLWNILRRLLNSHSSQKHDEENIGNDKKAKLETPKNGFVDKLRLQMQSDANMNGIKKVKY